MMKRICLLLLLSCIFAVTVYAQQGTFKGNIDTEHFPEVSFIWNEYNPDILGDNQFTVKENGKEVRFTVQNFAVDTVPHKNRTILFLWEDMPVRKEQYDFTQTVLLNFFKKSSDTTARFNIAVFNRQQDNGTVLKLRFPNFTFDKNMLADTAVSEYDHDNTFYSSNSSESDLLLAIREGLNLIGQESKNDTRAIVVITAGRNLYVQGVEVSPIIQQSLKNKIPVYVVQYQTRANESTLVDKLVKETYGQLIIADSRKKTDRGELVESVIEELLKHFNELNRRHYGQDYKLTFTSLSKRDGNLSQIVVNENSPINYNVPDFSLFVWTKAHLILFLILLVISLAAITFGVFFGIKLLKGKLSDIKEQKQEEERKRTRQQSEQEALKRKLNETQEALKRQQKAAEQEKQHIQEQEQTERLAKLMRAKNLQPRILAVSSSEMFNISGVTTTVGRNGDNDIVLSGDTVSKYHAQIIFNGTGFEICDLQSANGIILNGQYIESAELKNGDIIQLGETIIKFYV
jgi:pSer/pThr/pTyr-binding forkhead associated (FHA) protein